MKYHWQSNYTGEIVPTFKDVILNILWYIKCCKFDKEIFSWKYSKKGF